MELVIAPIFSMFFTIFVAMVGGFILFRTHSRQLRDADSIAAIRAAMEQGRTAIETATQAIAMIRTKHYETLAAETLELAHKLALHSNTVDALTERAVRFEAKIAARIRRAEPEPGLVDNSLDFPHQEIEPVRRKRKFGEPIKQFKAGG